MRARVFVYVQTALATLLGIQAIGVASLIMWLDSTHPAAGHYRVVRLTPDTDTSVRLEWHMGIDTRVIVVATLALGSVLQGFALVLQGGRWVRALRWLEGLGCMPATLMAVALEAGVRDVYAIEALFGLAWASQMLAFCADGWLQQAAVLVASVPAPAMAPLPTNASPTQPSPPYVVQQLPPPRPPLITAVDPFMRGLGTRMWVLPHGAAWAMLLMAYAPVFNILLARAVGDDAIVLVCGQFFLLSLHLIVQSCELAAGTACVESPSAFETVFYSTKQARQAPNIFGLHVEDYEDAYEEEDDDGGPASGGVLLSYSRVDRLAHIFRRCNVLYTLLSFLSKTLLCWSVLVPGLN